jgi:dTDP-4-amino-4,6-dideoxygalactose transaminase
MRFSSIPNIHTTGFITKTILQSLFAKDVEAKIKKQLKKRLPFRNINIFRTGREALYEILKNVDKPEIIIPAFGCSILSITIKKAGKIPVYVDIDKQDLSINLNCLKQKLNKNTGAIIIVNEFGNLYPVNKLEEIRKLYSGIIIEDQAISLGSSYNENNLIYDFFDYILLSGGLGKPISAYSWGAYLTNQETTNLLKKNKNISDEIKTILYLLIFQLLKINIFYYTLKTLIEKQNTVNSKNFKRQLKKATKVDNYIILRQIINIDEFIMKRYKTGVKIKDVLEKDGTKVPLQIYNLHTFPRIPVIIEDTDLFINTFKKHDIEVKRPHREVLLVDGNKYKNFSYVYNNIVTIPIKFNEDYLLSVKYAINDFKKINKDV